MHKHIEMKKGFTLIELSIVLVVIGLLIGGILVGQSLITSAELTRLGTQVQQYNILWTQFKERYKYYPGDVPYSVMPFSQCASDPVYCEGDGNGVYHTTVDSPYCCSMASNETANGFAHLSYAGMLPGKQYVNFTSAESSGSMTTNPIGTKLPELPRKITMIATSTDYDSHPFNGGSECSSSNVKYNYYFLMGKYFEYSHDPYRDFRGAALSPVDARAFDTKFDDGFAWSGKILANQSFSNPGTNCKISWCGWGPWDVNDAHYDYDMSVNTESCLMYWAIDAN